MKNTTLNQFFFSDEINNQFYRIVNGSFANHLFKFSIGKNISKNESRKLLFIVFKDGLRIILKNYCHENNPPTLNNSVINNYISQIENHLQNYIQNYDLKNTIKSQQFINDFLKEFKTFIIEPKSICIDNLNLSFIDSNIVIHKI